MKLQSTIKRYGIFALALVAPSFAVLAGPYKSVAMKEVAPPPMDEPCFAAGDFSADIFAGYVWGFDDEEAEEVYEDGAAGGVGFNYFFTEMVGVGVDAYWFDSDGTIHNFDGSLIIRFPIQEACIAPYVYGGGGFHTNSTNQGSFHAGAGVEWKFSDSTSLFGDGRYTWLDETNDTALARLGLRFSF